jgi:Domain of unknown function (DUF2017)
VLRRRRVERRAADRYAFRLDEHDRELMGVLIPQLREPLAAGSEGEVDNALWRLFPDAYSDAEMAAEYRDMVHDDLVAGRLEALKVVESTLHADELDEEQLGCWIGVVNDWRLVLGTRLDVSEDDDLEERYDGPDGHAYALYQHLSYLLSDLVDAQLEAFPE